MLIEQAFFHLPEILHGSGYQPQEYEYGIVGAFSLALLQTLNGRNAPSPIGFLQHERRYRVGGVYTGVQDPRHLRADLYLDSSRLHIASRRLSQYGWRHRNWIEAKFMRGQAGDADKHSTNKTNYVAGHLADLVRLACLVPEDRADESTTGRYFLHVYDAQPEFYLTYRRPWCRSICMVGVRSLSLATLETEVGSVRSVLGDLPNLTIDLRVTNFVIRPTDTSHLPCYWCILTRLDQIKITHGTHSMTISPDRTIQLNGSDDMDQIAAFVATTLHIPPASPESAPPPQVDPEEISDSPDASAPP